MMTQPLDCSIPRNFHFAHTVYSHGWCELPPFELQPRPLALQRPLRLRGSVVMLRASAQATNAQATNAQATNAQATNAQATNARAGTGGRAMEVTVHGARALSAAAARECAARVRSMFQLDLDLSPLYALVRQHAEHAWMARARAGRMLRGDTFFEDVVKMILTTNCSWSLTLLMTSHLVDAFGEVGPGGRRAFPTPDAIAASSERALRERITLGYRAPYILELARRCAAGSLAIEEFRASAATAEDLYKELLAVRGVGPYAAGNLLKLLGRFEYLGLDSWCRAQFSRLHAGGAAVSDAEIRSRYAAFDEWQGLVMWLDLTQDWYRSTSPFSP
jgi:N-glycosylase/DNA lyase